MIDPRDVTAVLVTRGDQEEAIQEIISTLIFDVVVWNNAAPGQPDLGAYGRYHLCRHGVATPFVYLQDDDCTTDEATQHALVELAAPDRLVSNMNPHHNAGMPLLALPGWGAIAPTAMLVAADERWLMHRPDDWASDDYRVIGCDIVIPVLCPSFMIDLGHENLPHAWNMERTHRQPGYTLKKQRYYQQAAELRARLDQEGMAA